MPFKPLAVSVAQPSPYFDINQPNSRKRREQFFEANRLALIDEIRNARTLSPNGILGINAMVVADLMAELVA